MATDRVEALIVPSSLAKRPSAPRRLFCFSWAGGGAAFFIRLARKLPADIELLTLRVPGRDSRVKERPYLTISEIADDTAEAIRTKYANKPFAFYGHSLGARISFEVARRLKEHGLEPVHMFVSGSFAAQSPHDRDWMEIAMPDGFTDEVLLEYMLDKRGTPPDVLKDKSLQAMFLPSLRSDLHILQSHVYTIEGDPPLTCSLTAMDGLEDVDHFLKEWSAVTSGDFDIKMFPGGHFFFMEPGHDKMLVDFMCRVLRPKFGKAAMAK